MRPTQSHLDSITGIHQIMGVDQIMGIDQTGAVLRSGKNKGQFEPLFVVTLKNGSYQTSRASLSEVIESALQNRQKTWITMDAVLGLPQSIQRPGETLWNWIDEAQEATPGREGAEAFFKTLWQSRTAHSPALQSLPPNQILRRCEQIARAQSLFAARPYQRNVQAGTLRVWKELAALTPAVRRQIAFWPFHSSPQSLPQASKIILAEGYPRLWKSKAPLRTPRPLDPNFRDAAQLAFSTWALLSLPQPTNSIASKNEGWIFGLETE